jgi:hypothetical protein
MSFLQCAKDIPYVLHPHSLGASRLLQDLNSQLVVKSGFLRSRVSVQQRGRGVMKRVPMHGTK